MMTLKYILAGVLVALAIASAATSAPEKCQLDPAAAAGTEVGGRGLARHLIGAILDFNSYKLTFQRHYPTLSETLRRQKLFLARAFRVLVSAIKFVFRRAEFYLSINKFTDRTNQELDQMQDKRMSRPLDEQPHEQPGQSADSVFSVPLASWRTGDADDSAELQRAALSLESQLEAKHKQNKDRLRTLQISDLVKAGEQQHQHQKQQQQRPSFWAEMKSLFGGHNSNGQSSQPAAPLVDQRDLYSEPKIHLDIDKQANWDLPLAEHLNISSAAGGPQNSVVIDHRDSKCLRAPVEQGRCGSCNSIVALTILEYHHCMQRGGKFQKFSEQYLLDCGSRAGMMGCNGASDLDIMRFIRNFGIELDAYYWPYAARAHQCPFDGSHRLEQAGYLRVENLDISAVPKQDFDYALRFGPLNVGVVIFADLYEYGGGLYERTYCSQLPVNHALALVGHGREDGRDYWIAMNSWGADWGERGYVRILKSHRCMSKEAMLMGDYSGRGKAPQLTVNLSHDLSRVLAAVEARESESES